jgi:hypothetical protein
MATRRPHATIMVSGGLVHVRQLTCVGCGNRHASQMALSPYVKLYHLVKLSTCERRLRPAQQGVGSAHVMRLVCRAYKYHMVEDDM